MSIPLYLQKETMVSLIRINKCKLHGKRGETRETPPSGTSRENKGSYKMNHQILRKRGVTLLKE
jgi:hypothetical protein